MVTVESGSTLPLLSATVPVIPPRVCCAREHRESCKSTASREMPSFIFVAIFVAINLVGINVNLVKVETEIQSGRPGRGLQFDYLLTIYGVAGSCLAPRLLVL